MVDFFKKYFTLIVFILLLIGGLKSCADSRKMDKIMKEITLIKNEIQSIKDSTYTKTEFDIELKIMGLESEKRMIQATDRKLWDLERQNDIEKEIKMLRGK